MIQKFQIINHLEGDSHIEDTICAWAKVFTSAGMRIRRAIRVR